MKRAVYSYLLNTYGRLPFLWIGIITETIRTIVLRVVTVILFARVASDVLSGNFAAAKSNILLFIILNITAPILAAVGEVLSVHATDKEYEKLLLEYHRKLTSKDMSFYRDHQTGYLASLFRQHLDGTMALVRLFRTDVIRMIVSLIVPVIVLFTMGWQLGLVAACVVIVQSGYVLWSSARANKYRRPAQEVYRKLTGEVADEMTNALAFKSSGGESEAHTKVKELAAQEAKMFALRHKLTALLDLPRSIIASIGVGVGFLIVLRSAAGNATSISLMILTFTYMFQIMRNANDLPDLIQRNDEHIARVYPTLEYLTESHETVRDPKNPKLLHITKGAIEIKNVTFGYKTKSNPEYRKVFSDLTISIKGGEHVGIVGLSGAGKSTLAGLLMRFDDIDKGSILIDGTDIRDVRQSELRQNIAYVPQEPLLFHRSVRENINYFKKNATEEEIINAAKIAHAHEFINELSEGYDSLVGERGIKLSGGQKQRIAIARAILKNAPIIIFDEATSALDSESERIIQNALPQIIKKSTALVIAHRLSTISRLDRIIVMDNGKVIEQGTHNELIAVQGKYFSLWKKQSEIE